MTGDRRTIPDAETPGRYQLIGFVGKRSERLHTYARRSRAQRVAATILNEGYSTAYEQGWTKVQVYDRVNRLVVYEETKARKSYGR
jgi:hypothetical protein